MTMEMINSKSGERSKYYKMSTFVKIWFYTIISTKLVFTFEIAEQVNNSWEG